MGVVDEQGEVLAFYEMVIGDKPVENEPTTPDEPTTPETPDSGEKPNEDKKGNSGLITGILITLGVLAVGGIATLFIIKKKNKANKKEN